MVGVLTINWFKLHYDEAFSSLRIAGYKGFTRFHINSVGDLEVYTLGVDKVPKEWELDPEWNKEPNSNPYIPSKWMAAAWDQEPLQTVKVIEKFLIQRNDRPDDQL
ncbi:polyadenylate-binding protein RBP47C-like [Fagus crenata]